MAWSSGDFDDEYVLINNLDGLMLNNDEAKKGIRLRANILKQLIIV